MVRCYYIPGTTGFYAYGFAHYPPDVSKEFPVYDPDGIMLVAYGNALFIAGLTVMGIKLADEKKLIISGSFTMFAILSGNLKHVSLGSPR